MLSASSIEWIDEAMAHNNAHDGEEWLRRRTRDATGADTPPPMSLDRVDARGDLVRHEARSFNLSEALLRSAS